MESSVSNLLSAFVQEANIAAEVRIPTVRLDPGAIKAVLINEIVPADPADDFYGDKVPAGYLSTTLPLFAKAGLDANSVDEITVAGIYLTNAVKTPKSETTIPKEVIERDVPLLAAELALFPNLRAIMLMGDVAIKAFNRIAKKHTGRSVVPSGATYKLRANEYYYGSVRVFPSYIMTGRNILIEKSKVEMAADDIRKMLAIIGAR